MFWIGWRTQDIVLSAFAVAVFIFSVLLLIAVTIMLDDHFEYSIRAESAEIKCRLGYAMLGALEKQG